MKSKGIISVKDQRSRKIVVVAHCILNQNAKVYGIAKFPGVITPVVELMVNNGLGIIQMPCPETTYCGIRRCYAVKEQYDNPTFREHCKRLANTILNQIEDYNKSGYKIIAVLGADGSPTCGVNKTLRWGGIIPYKLPETPNIQKLVHEKGVYIELLSEEMKKRKLDIPFIGIPEAPKIGSLNDAIIQLKKSLGQ